MGKYTITIKSSDAARQKAAAEGYNFVVAKGVSTSDGVDYNAAWIVVPPNLSGSNIAINWDVSYQAGYTTSTIINQGEIDVTGDPIEVEQGGYYVVDGSGTLGPDPNKPKNPSRSGFHFRNDAGYAAEYTPVLLASDNTGAMVPLWAADTGVLLNGQISATPVEVVRVWLGKYQAGEAVIADYSGQVVQFNLTKLFAGTATLDDNLSGWSALSSNANIVDSYSKQLEDMAAGTEVALLSGLAGDDKPPPTVWAIDPVIVDIIAAFNTTLTVAAIAYLTNKLINLFPANIRPKKIKVTKDSAELEFSTAGDTLRAQGSKTFETAVNNALAAAVKDASSGLAGETWKLSQSKITVTYDV